LDVKATGHPIVSTDPSFEDDVLRSGVPTLVDFWAEWCGPCKAFEPTLKEFARHMAGKVRIVKVNVDSARATAARYGIQSIPTLVLFRGGSEAGRISGAVPLEQLKRFVSQKGVLV
jgi:thioredoxin